VDLGVDAARIAPYLQAVAGETLADLVTMSAPPVGWPTATVKLSGGEARVALRRAVPRDRAVLANA
jgi:hypothetical protein